jgi:DNA-directed RNA polymerase subunit omega
MDLPSSIDSKFRYILIAAKRARQIQAGGRPLVQSPSKKATKVAQQEVSAGLIPVENIEIKSENGDQDK